MVNRLLKIVRAILRKSVNEWEWLDAGGMTVDAALAGLGIGYVLEDRAMEHFNSGTLLRLQQDWCPPFPGFYLYCPGRRQLSPALGAFIEAIRVPARETRRRQRFAVWAFPLVADCGRERLRQQAPAAQALDQLKSTNMGQRFGQRAADRGRVVCW